MTRIWSWLGLNLGKHAGLVSLVGLLVTLVLGVGITQLDFATGQDSYLNKDDEVYQDNVAYQGLFGGQAMVTLYTMDEGHDVVDLFTTGNVERLRAQEEQLGSTRGVFSVISPLTALQFTHNLVSSDTGDPTQSVSGRALLGARDRDPDPASAARRLTDAATNLERISAVPADQRTFDNPDWVRFLLYDNQGEIRMSLRPFFPDATHAQMVTRLDGNASLEDEGRAAEAVVAVTDPETEPMDNASVVTTGAAELLKELNDYLRGGMLTLGAIAVAIMVLILLVLFDVRWRLLPLAVILIGVVWAFGLAGYLGIPLSVVTIAGLPVMLGVGIDYAIQMHARVEEEVAVGRRPTPARGGGRGSGRMVIDRAEHPIQETSRKLGPALLVVTFDAIFAFAALRFAQVPMIRHFGLLLAVGIAAICLCSIVMPLAVLGIREYRSPTSGRKDSGPTPPPPARGLGSAEPVTFRPGPLGRLVVWLGSLPSRTAGPVLAVVSVVVFAGGIAVEGQLDLQTDPEEWVNQGSAVIQKIDRLKDETGTSAELGIFVQAGSERDDDATALFGDETVQWVQGFADDELEQRPRDLITASSIVTTIGWVLQIPDTTYLPPTGDDVAAAYEVAPRDIQRSLVNPDADALNLVFRTGPGSLDERAVYTNEIRDELAGGGDEVPPSGVTATPSGLAVVGVGLLENLEANRILLTYLAIIFVGIFLAFRLRSLVRSLLSLVPVLIAVGMASLVAWALGLKLSPMTAVGGPLVVAACTEFTSLILLRYIEERRRGYPPRQAVDVAASRTGRAFIVSAMTAISGVAVIAFSSLPLLRDFGIIVALNVAVALLSALVILPPLLVWADRRGWASRGMVAEPAQPEGAAAAPVTTGR